MCVYTHTHTHTHTAWIHNESRPYQRKIGTIKKVHRKIEHLIEIVYTDVDRS
jgi:hypothetical protein